MTKNKVMLGFVCCTLSTFLVFSCSNGGGGGSSSTNPSGSTVLTFDNPNIINLSFDNTGAPSVSWGAATDTISGANLFYYAGIYKDGAVVGKDQPFATCSPAESSSMSCDTFLADGNPAVFQVGQKYFAVAVVVDNNKNSAATNPSAGVVYGGAAASKVIWDNKSANVQFDGTTISWNDTAIIDPNPNDDTINYIAEVDDPSTNTAILKCSQEGIPSQNQNAPTPPFITLSCLSNGNQVFTPNTKYTVKVTAQDAQIASTYASFDYTPEPTNGVAQFSVGAPAYTRKDITVAMTFLNGTQFGSNSNQCFAAIGDEVSRIDVKADPAFIFPGNPNGSGGSSVNCNTDDLKNPTTGGVTGFGGVIIKFVKADKTPLCTYTSRWAVTAAGTLKFMTGNQKNNWNLSPDNADCPSDEYGITVTNTANIDPKNPQNKPTYSVNIEFHTSSSTNLK